MKRKEDLKVYGKYVIHAKGMKSYFGRYAQLYFVLMWLVATSGLCRLTSSVPYFQFGIVN